MNPNEWALVIFTVVMQMAVGAFVVLGGVHFFATRRNGIEEADKLSDRALIAIGPLAVLALVVTLLHLGNPINAPRAITHFATSWLSREVTLALVFSIVGAVFAYMQWRKVSTAAVRNTIGLINAAIGLVLVYVMSMVYRLPTVPAWNTLATPVTFFITCFLLGSLAMGAAFVANYWYLKRKQMDPENVQFSMLATTLRWIALFSIALLGLQFIVIPLYIAQLAGEGNPAAVASIEVMSQQYITVFAVRLILLFVGAGLFSLFVYSMASSESRLRVLGNIAYLAFALVLVSEILGRFLFYASMVKIGL